MSSMHCVLAALLAAASPLRAFMLPPGPARPVSKRPACRFTEARTTRLGVVAMVVETPWSASRGAFLAFSFFLPLSDAWLSLPPRPPGAVASSEADES
eukprot:3736044-Pleurochrysis_carterae.AAC.1